jgi:hypothetical protein
MTTFTQTTNYSFKKPIVGSATDQWGTHLNETIDGLDSQLKTLADSITSQQLEQLGNVVNVTPVDDQFLRYNGTNWTAETVTIPNLLNDLSNVSGTPSSGDVLTYNGSAWAPASVTSAAVADGSVTNAKLHPSLQTVIGRILVTDDDDSPTDNQILVYSTTDSEWKYADQAGSTLQTLTDVNSTGLSDGDLMKYDGTAGEFVFIDAAAARTLLNVDVSGTDNSIPTTLDTTSHDYLTLSSQQITLNPIVLTDDVSGTLPIANGGTSASTASGARTALGLGALATQDTITESQISDLQSYITASSTDTLTNKSGNISQWTNDSGYLTAETNDLSNVSGTLAIANGGTGSSSAATARVALLPALATNGSKLVSVNSGATDIEYIATSTLSITESQISDLQSYLTAEVNDLSAAVTWTNVPDANITQSSVTQHQAALSITESQISDLQSYLTASSTDTLTNKSGNISMFTNDSGYLTAETNDLTNVSGTLGTGNGGTGLSAIGTANQVLAVNSGATGLEFQTISITESQISDLQTYLTAETNDLSAAVTWTNVPDANITQSSVTQHQAALSITESQISDLQAYLTDSSTATLTNKSGNISQWTNDSGYLTAETNDLSTVSGTLGTANGGTGLTTIGTAGQVLKVNSGATALEFADESGGGGSGSSYIEHSSTVSDSLAISAGTNRMYVGNTTFSGSGTMAGYLVVSHGYGNFTSASALNVTGTLNVVS